VCFNGIELGRPVDVLLDRQASRAVGLEVVCGNDERRFLPLAVTTVGDDLIAIGSPFCSWTRVAELLPRGGEDACALRGARIDQRGVEGVLRDIVLGEDGRIEPVVLATGDGTQRVPLDGLSLS